MNIENCFANRHFLVVDDEAFIRTVVARFLKGSGAANVVEAADGGAAIAALADYDLAFDAVISDIQMAQLTESNPCGRFAPAGTGSSETHRC